MRAVLISIQPKWCELIAKGEKTVEVRKTRPKLEIPGDPFKVYIDCTQDKHGWFRFGKKERLDGKVIGEFVCDYISIFRPKSITCESSIKKASCLTVQALIDYAGKNNHLFGWHISKLKIYDKPKELCEFTKYSEDDIRPCENGCECQYEYYDYSEDCRACGIDFGGDDCPHMKMSRPPQSWCYVEG